MDADKPKVYMGRDTLLKVLEKFVEDRCFTIMQTKGRDYENRGDPFEPGQAAPFEYWADRTEFGGVVKFKVIFVDK